MTPQSRAREASRRQIAEARTETQHLLPFSLEEIQTKWATLERNVEDLSGSQLKGGGDDDLYLGALVRVALRDLRRYEDQMAAKLAEKSDVLLSEQVELTRTYSRLSSDLQQRDSQVKALQGQLRQAEACRTLLGSRLEISQEEDDPRLATERATAVRLRAEERQAADRLTRIEEDLAFAQAALASPSRRTDAEDMQSTQDSSQVAEAQGLLAKAKARCEELLVAADTAGLELRAEMDNAARITEEVTEAHRSLAEAGTRSHQDQDDLEKLREELAEAESMASKLRAAAAARADELRTARKSAREAPASPSLGRAAPMSGGYATNSASLVPRPTGTPPRTPQVVEKLPSRVRAKTPPRSPQLGLDSLKIDDLESSLLSIIAGNDALEQRIRANARPE